VRLSFFILGSSGSIPCNYPAIKMPKASIRTNDQGCAAFSREYSS
jgi:hypothetical protein